MPGGRLQIIEEEKNNTLKLAVCLFGYLFANGFPLQSRNCKARQCRILSGISAISFLEQSSSSKLTNCPISGRIR